MARMKFSEVPYLQIPHFQLEPVLRSLEYDFQLWNLLGSGPTEEFCPFGTRSQGGN